MWPAVDALSDNLSDAHLSGLERLFSGDVLDGFAAGAAQFLVRMRNRNLGNLLLSERNVFYLQIVYRMLCFRREHELEPLFEDLYAAVQPAQESVAGEAYRREEFRQDMHQLDDWGLVSCRVEKERLRGYRDASRRKYRYRLLDDTIAFLVWLEERLQEDIEDKGEDTRNLLFDVESRAREALSQVEAFTSESGDAGAARTIVYLLVQLDELTDNINLHLSDLNVTVLGFLFGRYDIDQVKSLLKELEFYVDSYLRQIMGARGNLLPAFEQLGSQDSLRKYERCLQLLEEERARTPHLLQRRRKLIEPRRIVQRLTAFYEDSGGLDGLCRRMNESYMKVYAKLKAHLRELERKNTRLEDLNARLRDLARLPEDACVTTYFRRLLAPAQIVIDPNYWDDQEKATPPQPRREQDRHLRTPRTYIREKTYGDKPVRSVRQARLEHLKRWIREHVAGDDGQGMLSQGRYEGFEDVRGAFEVVVNGLLQKGRNLHRIGYGLQPGSPDQMRTVEADGYRLTFREATVRTKP